MKSVIHYDLDGCHGTLVTRERSSWPSPLGWACVVAFVLAAGALFLIHPFAPFLIVFLGIAAVLGGGREDGVRAADFEPRTFEWFFAVHPVARRFRVELGELTLEDGELPWVLPLRGATFEASAYGVRMVPRLGDAIELYWDEASLDQATVLCEALRSAAAAEVSRGGASDVPDALARVRGAAAPEPQSP